MATHKEQTDTEGLHRPKDFDAASNNTALIKNGSGTLEYRDLTTLGATGPSGPSGTTLLSVSVLDIDNPDLSAQGGVLGDSIVVYEVVALGENKSRRYVFDTEVITADAPRVVTGDSGTWVLDEISTASTLQSAYDNSTDPEITTDATNGAVTYKQGSGASVNLLEFEDSSAVDKGRIATDEWKVNTQAYSSMNTLSDAATIATDCSAGNVHEVTLTDNRALGAPTNLKNGATYIWIITQDGTGSRTLSYNAVFKFQGGTAPVLSTAGSSVDILTGVSDGTNVYCSLAGDFQ
jgi:hypothetical protein